MYIFLFLGKPKTGFELFYTHDYLINAKKNENFFDRYSENFFQVRSTAIRGTYSRIGDWVFVIL